MEESKTGREFQKLKHKTDKQRMAFATKRVFEIHKNWKKLISTGLISCADFDEDSLQDLKGHKNYAAFEPIFRLVPDLLVKGFKLVELSKIWYNSYRRMVGPIQAHHHTTVDFYKQIDQMDEMIEQLEYDIEYKKSTCSSKQQERRLLLNQLMRVDQLKEKHDGCLERERELKDYYKQLKEERNKEHPKLDKLRRDDPEYKVVYNQIQYLADSMKKTYRELQTVSYEVALVKQDLNIEMGNRSNIIHMQQDTKQSVNDMHGDISMEEGELTKYSHTREKLKENCNRMQMALYSSNTNRKSSDFQDSGENNKQKTLSIDKVTKIHSKNQTGKLNQADSDNSGKDIEEELERTLTQGENISFERESTTTSGNPSTIATPLPPILPKAVESGDNKQTKSHLTFNPNSSGIIDEVEAKEYDDRVKRLQQKFELDFSGLKTSVDCSSPVESVRSSSSTSSREDTDMESENEPTTRSKKIESRKAPDRYSPLSDIPDSEEYVYRQPYPITTPGELLQLLAKK